MSKPKPVYEVLYTVTKVYTFKCYVNCDEGDDPEELWDKQDKQKNFLDDELVDINVEDVEIKKVNFIDYYDGVDV